MITVYLCTYPLVVVISNPFKFYLVLIDDNIWIMVPILIFLFGTVHNFSYTSLTLKVYHDHRYILYLKTFYQVIKEFSNLYIMVYYIGKMRIY